MDSDTSVMDSDTSVMDSDTSVMDSDTSVMDSDSSNMDTDSAVIDTESSDSYGNASSWSSSVHVSPFSKVDTSSSCSSSMEGPHNSDESCDSDSESEYDRCFSAAAKKPLYPGAQINVLTSHFLILQFAVQQGLSLSAFSQLLQLISVLLPQQTELSKSVYSLEKFFTDLFPDITSTLNSYCSSCLQPLHSTVCNRIECIGSHAEKFVTIPLEAQLRRKLEDPEIWQILQKCKQRRSQPGVLEDVYDGEEYRRHASFLSLPANLSLICNTDGVAIFRSSKTSIWPVWLVINELPKSQRFLKKNMLLFALWFSRHKPLMSTYLRPLVDAVNTLLVKGMDVQTPAGKMKCHAMLLQCSVDLPARALVLNSKQFNGKYGCLYCESTGETPPGDHLHRYWPPPSSGLTLRSHESVMQNATKATSDGEPVKGIKGASVLCIHHPYNLVKGTVIDCLHAVFLGVVHQLLNLWFSRSNHSQSFYIGNKIDICNKRLLNIKVPDTVSRIPHSLSDLSHWKGSQMRSWILFFALPVLYGILPDPYFNHCVLLIASLRILLSDRITLSELRDANTYLTHFYLKFPDLYGRHNCTMNIHLLCHLATCVRNWGPLWAYSCFPFEGMNFHLKKLFHGTRDKTQQMAFAYLMSQVLPSVQTKVVDTSVLRVQKFVDVLLGKKRQKRQVLSDSSAIIGAVKVVSLSSTILHLLNQCLLRRGILQTSLRGRQKTFHRLQLNGEVYYSQNYRRVKKRNSYTVSYKNEELSECFGQILFFVLVDSHTSLAVIRRFTVIEGGAMSHFRLSIPVQGIIPVVETERNDVIFVENIQQKCLCLDISPSCKCVATFPNAIMCD